MPHATSLQVRTRRFRSAVAAAVLAVPVALAPQVPAGAEILDTGFDTAAAPAAIVPQTVLQGSCRIAWYRQGGEDTEIERLRAFGYEIQLIGRSQLAYPQLADWDIVVIAYTEPGFLAAQQPALQAFVDTGGGLLIHQPNHPGLADYTPIGFSVDIASPVWCSATGHVAHVDNASHPVTAGLSDADLSGAFDAVASLGASFTVLASSTECSTPALAVGTSGIGRVAFDTGNASPSSIRPGEEAYWDALLRWLCTSGPIGVEPVTWGRTKASYR